MNTFCVLTTSDWIAISAIIVPSIGSFIYLIFKFGALFNKVNQIQEEMSIIPVKVSSIESKMTEMHVKVEELWRVRTTGSNSPLILNSVGKKILHSSQIEHFISDNYKTIVDKVKARKPKNSFQIQEEVIHALYSFKKNPEFKTKFENCAFNSGTDIDTVLFVAAINVRDSILKEIN
jgi:hypothetical protein